MSDAIVTTDEEKTALFDTDEVIAGRLLIPDFNAWCKKIELELAKHTVEIADLDKRIP